MSKDFEYDPETGSFRFDESGGKTKKKNDVDVGGWILIAALFAFGLWPIGLIALISKLSDKPKKVNSSRSGMRTSTSPNANVTGSQPIGIPTGHFPDHTRRSDRATRIPAAITDE